MKKALFICSLAIALSGQAKAEKARFLYTDLDALQARVDLIQQAKKEILINYYAVTNDDTSTAGIALLCEAAKRGVKVSILMDALSNSVKEATIASSERFCIDKDGNHNMEYKLFNPLDLTDIDRIIARDHGKMLAVDGKYLISGGRNVDGKYFGLHPKRNFKDLDAMISGRVVREAVVYFKELWNKSDIVKKPVLRKFNLERLATGCEGSQDMYMCKKYLKEEIAFAKREMNFAVERMDALIQRLKDGKGTAKLDTGKDWFLDAHEVSGIRFLNNSTRTNDFKNSSVKMSDELYKLFSKAQRKILILSPYLIPNKRVEYMFADLIARGVEITIITNSLKSTDNLAAQAGYKAAKNHIIQLGIKLYEYNLVHTAHAKAAVIDDEIALVGTFNLDPRSSQLNREMGLVFADQRNLVMAKDLTAIINKFKSESLLVGLNGEEVNIERQNHGVSALKINAVSGLKHLVPLFKDQL